MDTFLRKIEDNLSTGDPEVRSWFLVRHNYLPFILCGSYVIFIKVIGPALMRNRKPFELRKVMIIFNFSLVVTYIIALATTIWFYSALTKEEICTRYVVRKGHESYILATCAWLAYVLKYVEFLDTVFFILRKKNNQVSLLHVVHHAIIPIVGWIVLRTERSALQGIPASINGFVHIIMYSYYGLSAMGPRVRKYLWWKKYLTQLQMIQFFVIILIVLVLAPLAGCKMLLTSIVLDSLIAFVFLYLFYKFYKSNF